jgi:CTP:molybdopterin cytidylyltransferase MocA
VIAAAVLAAGRGSRLGGAVPKPLVSFAGRPLVAHALDAALASGLEPVLLVVGADSDAVAGAAPAHVEVVRNEAWATGIASSLRAALLALTPRSDVPAVVVGLADQPLVGAAAYRRLADAYDAGAHLAAATYGGVRGNPVLLARTHWPDALALTGDVGGRGLFEGRAVTDVPCDGTGDPTDVDTSDDLATLERRWRSTTASE